MAHYDVLMQSGWKMNDLDQMDFLGYFDLLIWRAMQEYKPSYIDQCPMFDLS